MKSDRFFVINIVDRLARMAMLIFEGLILGVVLALFYFNVFNPSIGWTLIIITAYILFFSVYVAWTNARRRITRIEIYKNHLCIVYSRKNQVPQRTELEYSDIKSFKISSGTDFKNKEKETPDPNKYSLRIYGFDTVVESKDGTSIHFSDSQDDGVLMYSPAYIYRMLDLKNAIPDLPLELVNFNSKKDAENFTKQFEYYKETGKTLPFIKNTKYLLALLRYSLVCAGVAFLICAVLSSILFFMLKNTKGAIDLIYAVAEILGCIVIPMWFIAVASWFMGNKQSLEAREQIKDVIEN